MTFVTLYVGLTEKNIILLYIIYCCTIYFTLYIALPNQHIIKIIYSMIISIIWYINISTIIRTKVDYMNVFDVVLLCLPSLVDYWYCISSTNEKKNQPNLQFIVCVCVSVRFFWKNKKIASGPLGPPVIFSNNIVHTINIIIHFQIKLKNFLGPKILS